MSSSLRGVAGMQLVGNAALLWLGYYWLGIGESRFSAVAWSGLVALGIVCLAVWLHGSAFAYFAEPKAGLRGASAMSLRRIAPLLAAALAALAVYLLFDRLSDYAHAAGFQSASYLTMKLRKPVRPSSLARAVDVALWVVRWMILPVLLLPMIAGAAARGWRGLRDFGAVRGKRLYWIQTPILLVCALWIPFRLLGWVPHAGSFGMEVASFVLRAAAAYTLAVAAWVSLVFLTAAGKPR